MSKKIFDIFSSIAGVYDVMGHLFSFGIDGLWREMTDGEALIVIMMPLRQGS
jgi:ubiquinone/menaquinone biosynthesis C-methylase UbiE